ncbi:ABC transporter substrate-binding protein [Frankia sp. CNm7]|uniref:ABC transporter substrate-binding protein n=2 Tax=Frankia nepalensis TaxID=1836974 RepID=A0A937RGG1_9ACTN|nr:ABC transporter substrate-binding protein [Frankia nepalensis]MBL7511535.1 ABC transporter substrate-binding protein [Frankia nepalensis]MBL7519250.1 ABC transporter substrate-binding protein [Frankia nepalensis]MBL7628525.1 ABC transporter substrate-binding protein [Frankia nepalensis]
MDKTRIASTRPALRRSRDRTRALAALAVLAGSLVLVACGGGDEGEGATTVPNATTAPGGVEEVLGPVAAASGTPVKIGMISDGKGAVTDLSFEGPVADATIAYLNERLSGLAGHPIEVVKCDTLADPGKGTDCANRMVEEDVVAVVVGSSSVVESIWTPLHESKIPVVFGGANAATILTDRESTFVLVDSAFSMINLPISLAKENKLDTVTVVAIDVPSVMSVYQKVAPAAFEKAGVKLNLVAIPPGTADMTPQMQQLVGTDTLVQLVGSDSFCIAALNGMRTVGFSGPVTAIAQCITDATRKAVPGDTLKNVTVSATAPVGTDNPSTKLFAAVVEAYGEGKGIEVNRQGSLSMFTTLAALQSATENLTGDVTSESIIAAIKAMPEKPLPGADPMKFRCGGLANPATPAVCVRGGLVTSLDDKGQPTGYRAVGSTPIAG